MTEEMTVVSMRLLDMFVVHPQQDNTRVCSKCGHPVGIYPSGQRTLRVYPKATIICTRCVFDGVVEGEFVPAASWPELMQEMRDSEKVKSS